MFGLLSLRFLVCTLIPLILVFLTVPLSVCAGTGTSPTRRTDSTTTSTSTATAAAAGATAGTAGSPDAVPGGESPARPAAHGSGPAGADA